MRLRRMKIRRKHLEVLCSFAEVRDCLQRSGLPRPYEFATWTDRMTGDMTIRFYYRKDPV